MKKTGVICFAVLVAVVGITAIRQLASSMMVGRQPTTDQAVGSNVYFPTNSPVIAGDSNSDIERQRIERILEYARRENGNAEQLSIAMEQENFRSASSLARKAGILDIRRRVPAGDIQIEYWLVGGLYSSQTKGVVFRRDDGLWSGVRVFEKGKRRTLEKEAVKTPKSSWEQWERSVTEMITPDRLRQMNPRANGTDGDTFVIRVASGGDFAERFCFAPDLEDRSITRISELALEEFDF